MKTQLHKALSGACAAALTVALGAAANAAYVVGGPTIGIQSSSGGYAWDGGSNVAPFRGALENPDYFGPDGVVNETILTVAIDFGAGDLEGLDGFIAPWWLTTDSAPYAGDVVDFFLGGGDLWLLQDSAGRDGIGALLGIPTVGQTDITPVNGGAPLFDGPFGLATDVQQGGGEEGYLSEADVLAAGGTVVGRNTEDQVIAAVWLPGQYAEGSGSLIVVSDIDMFTTLADFGALDSNAIFALNAFAFLATSEEAVPVPGAAVLMGSALAAFGAARRRRAGKRA